MLFKTQELRIFLSSVKKRKINNIQITSKKLKLTINTKKHLNRFSVKTINKLPKIKRIEKEANIQQPNREKDTANIPIEQHNYFTIVSPMIGTFYRSPAPNEKPFININDMVKVNQTVCIIEAMKLMNEIESEVNGQIVEILVEDGDIVDCGQALIKIKQEEKS